MVSTRVMFTLVVSKVFFPRVIFNVEFTLLNRICNPKESHFHGTRSLAFYCIVGNTDSSGVVAVDGGGRLWVSHFLQRESESEYCGLFTVEEQCT